MARPIIDFDQTRVYVDTSDILSQKTRLETASVASATSIIIQNNNGIANGDYIIVGEIGTEKAEIVRVIQYGEYGQDVYGGALYASDGSLVDGIEVSINPLLERDHDAKTPVYRIQYNQVKLYEDSVAVSTLTITPDYLASVAYTIDSEKTYQVAYYNSVTEAEAPKGMAVSGYDRLLCTIQDMRRYQGDIQSLGVKLIYKIDLARDDIRRLLLSQGNDFDDFDTLEQLSAPAALLACYYTYAEITKNEDDESSNKMNYFLSSYRSEIKLVLATLENEPSVQSFGFVQMIR